jgi:hypothetical protein
MTTEKQPLHLPLEFRQGGIQYLAPWIDDYGPLWAQLVEVQADSLADTPPHTVPCHCFPQRTRNRETHARPCCSGLTQAESRKKRTRKTGAFVINSPEILRSQQADTFGKTVRAGRGIPTRHLLPLGTDGELFPPSGATPCQHSPAIFRLHPAAEPMGFGAVTVIRLKRTFWHFGSTT